MNRFILLTLLSLSVMLALSCSGNGWVHKHPVFINSGLYLEDVGNADFNISDRLSPLLQNELQTSIADSIGRFSLQRMSESYNRGGFTSSRMVDDILDADYMLRVENIRISWQPTLNFVQPGPYFKVSVTASAWIGNEMVFRTTKSSTGNLAQVAGDGKKFYYPSKEEKNDVNIQRETIKPALRSAYGQVWDTFLRAGRRNLND